MKRVILTVLLAVVFLLGACNTQTNVEQGNRDVLYTHDRELKQNFEGVQLTMNYIVERVGDTVALQTTGTLVNDFSAEVYYTPAFIVEDEEGNQFASSDVQQIALVPAQELTFTEVIELPASVYETNESIRFFVPAVFTQPNSTSSGDALGDMVWWELPLK